jgi:hypothetical protein
LAILARLAVALDKAWAVPLAALGRRFTIQRHQESDDSLVWWPCVPSAVPDQPVCATTTRLR